MKNSRIVEFNDKRVKVKSEITNETIQLYQIVLLLFHYEMYLDRLLYQI